MTDEELNEIASRLRRTANDSLGGESLQKALARITVAEDVSWRGVMRRIADLIDRPTCEMAREGEGFRCSACGEYHDMSGFEKFQWAFCPDCGVRVIHKEEDDG